MADNFGFKPSLINPSAPYPPSSGGAVYPPGSVPVPQYRPPPGSAVFPPGSVPVPQYRPPPGSAVFPPGSVPLPQYQPPSVGGCTPVPYPPTYSPETYPSLPQYPSGIFRPPPLNSYPTPPPPPSYPPPSVCPPCHTPSVPPPPQWGSTLVTGGHKAYYWVDWTAHRMVPPTAVHGGVDKDGSQIYVGRAYHEGDWIPAKVIPEKHIAYVAYGGGEHGKNTFQVLCEQRFDWIPAHGGEIPAGSVEGGRTSSGEALYIGRVWHDGAHTVGKVQPSHGCCYIPYDMREMSFPTYEILVLRV